MDQRNTHAQGTSHWVVPSLPCNNMKQQRDQGWVGSCTHPVSSLASTSLSLRYSHRARSAKLVSISVVTQNMVLLTGWASVRTCVGSCERAKRRG